MRFVVIGLLILWAALVGYGFVAYFETEATGDSFVRGLNRIGVFFKWQSLALLAAFINWRVARAAPGMRGAGRLPLLLSGGFFALVFLLYGGAILLARA